jgi:hypothetical protein
MMDAMLAYAAKNKLDAQRFIQRNHAQYFEM